MTRNISNDPIVQVRPFGAGSGSAIGRSASKPSSAWQRLVFIVACVVAISVGLMMLDNIGPVTHAHRSGFSTGSLAITSLAATVAYLLIMAVLHILPTGYSPIRHAVSDYGVGPYKSMFTAALYVSCVSVLMLAFALLRGVGSPPLPTRDFVYLLLIPLARIGMTLFPTSLEGQRISRIGSLHYAFAVAAFTLTYLAISGMTPTLRDIDPTVWGRTPLAWTEWVVGPALALVVVTMLRPLRRLFGLVERIFLLTTNIWFALVAGLLISRLS